MLENGVELDERETAKSPLGAAELEALIGKRDYREFLNTRNELYRERDMKTKPPSRAEAVALMAKEVNLLRRPLLIDGDEILFGFDEKTWQGWLKGRT